MLEVVLTQSRHRGAPEVAADILNYFYRHPQAADSLEGIVRWRLLEAQIHRSLQETHQALDWLVARGFLVEETMQASGTLYRLNPQKSREIADFLGQATAPKTDPIEEEKP